MRRNTNRCPWHRVAVPGSLATDAVAPGLSGYKLRTQSTLNITNCAAPARILDGIGSFVHSCLTFRTTVKP